MSRQGGFTAWFESNLGVRQGCVHSPTAFAIFMHKLYVYLKRREPELDTPTLVMLAILLLLFADDMAFISKSAKGLQIQQIQLDVLDEWQDTHMSVNRQNMLAQYGGGRMLARRMEEDRTGSDGIIQAPIQTAHTNQ